MEVICIDIVFFLSKLLFYSCALVLSGFLVFKIFIMIFGKTKFYDVIIVGKSNGWMGGTILISRAICCISDIILMFRVLHSSAFLRHVSS